jgi:hypothetical protein
VATIQSIKMVSTDLIWDVGVAMNGPSGSPAVDGGAHGQDGSAIDPPCRSNFNSLYGGWFLVRFAPMGPQR